MKAIQFIIKLICVVSVLSGIFAFIAERFEKQNNHIPYGIYEKYIKRPLDAFLSTGAFIVLSPFLLFIALLVRLNLGSPVIFTQERPGKNEKIFRLMKFRSMSDERDASGNLLPDEKRLSKFGLALRATSIDELISLINIMKGDLAIVGPRPQLVRDMVFMTPEQRRRHEVRQGLTGLAQVMGRNSITWEEKLEWDLKYVDKISFLGDFKIVAKTFKKILLRKESIKELDIALDYGDALLKEGKVSREKYDTLQAYARDLINSNQ